MLAEVLEEKELTVGNTAKIPNGATVSRRIYFLVALGSAFRIF